MQNILVVEDSADIYSIITAALSPLKVKLTPAISVAEALERLNSGSYDLIILDLGLPDGDGLSVLSQVRQKARQAKTAVFIVSSKSDLSSKVSAFSFGADDYITKPFNTLEFRARIESKLKRMTLESDEQDIIHAGPLALETNKLSVSVDRNNQPIHLSPVEFRILALIAKRPGNIFSREQMLNSIWGSDIHISDRTIDTHVCSLRKKLGPFGKLINSVQGEGYRFLESRE